MAILLLCPFSMILLSEIGCRKSVSRGDGPEMVYTFKGGCYHPCSGIAGVVLHAHLPADIERNSWLLFEATVNAINQFDIARSSRLSLNARNEDQFSEKLKVEFPLCYPARRNRVLSVDR